MAMTREQAKAAAMRLRALKPELQAMNLDTLIAKIMVNEGNEDVGQGIETPGGMSRETAFQGLPQEAIAKALNFAPPKVVTPASPAPMRPGIPVMAPRPEARQLPQPAVGGPFEPAPEAAPAPAPAPAPAREEVAPAPARKYTSPIRVAASAAKEELDALTAEAEALKTEGKELSAASQLRLKMAQNKYIALETRALAEEAAEIDPERAALLARQEDKIAKQEGRVAAQERMAPWDAVLRGSMALMDPERGKNFVAALGSGLGVGLDEYEAAQAKAAEERARLSQQADQIALQRLDALEKARAAAQAAIAAGEQVDERTIRLAGAEDDLLVAVATRPARIQKAVAEGKKAEVQADLERASILAEIGYKGALAGAAGQRGEDDGVSPTAIFNAQESAQKQAIEYGSKVREKFNEWKLSDNGKANIRSGPEWDAYQADLRIYRVLRKKGGLESVLPDLGVRTKAERERAATGGASKAKLRYDTKTGKLVPN